MTFAFFLFLIYHEKDVLADNVEMLYQGLILPR